MCLWLIYLVIIWACIHYTNRQSIVSEACTVHLLFPSLTLCRTPFVSSTVNVFGRPHAVCAQTWIRWKTHITAGIINPTMTDISTVPVAHLLLHLWHSHWKKRRGTFRPWEAVNALMSSLPLLSCPNVSTAFALAVSSSHYSSSVSGGLRCSQVHPALFLGLFPAPSIPRRRHADSFDQSCPI